MTTKRTVYVVDDEGAIRRSLRLMLSVQGYSVTVFDSGTSLLDALNGLAPGCLLLDIRMPDIDGLEVQRQLAARGVGLPTVAMTGNGELSIALTALRNGAVSFIEKPFARSALIEALDAAFLKLEDPDSYAQHLTAMARKLNALDQQERDVLTCLAANKSNKTIAAELAMDPAVIDMIRSRILTKLNANSINEVLTIAFAAGYGRA